MHIHLVLRRQGTALLFGYAAAVAASAPWVHFDGGVGDTLRPSGPLGTAGVMILSLKMACMRLWGHFGRANQAAQHNHLHTCPW